MDPTNVDEEFRVFARVAQLYRAGLMVLNKLAIEDPVQALSQFAYGYAFERQGRSPAYAPIARDVIEELGRSDDFWVNEESDKRVWHKFCSRLTSVRTDAGANPKNNPLCWQGFEYDAKPGKMTIAQLSVVKFAQGLPEYGNNLLMWSKARLNEGDVQGAHNQLLSVNGIGPKIASFFLRDVAWFFDLDAELGQHRSWLQPVDVWVRRTVEHLGPKRRVGCARWIVEQAERSQVAPEAINAGMWYFGALIAGDEYTLSRAFHDTEMRDRLINEHIARLHDQIDHWGQA